MDFNPPHREQSRRESKRYWNNGRWTIEFARKLNTNNMDDILLEKGKDYSFATSITEIAGRKPEHDSDNPMFGGAGEVGELINIKIQ